MARQTKIKIDALDLPKIFAPGFAKRNGLVITGDNWQHFVYNFGSQTTDITEFSLPVPVPLDLLGNVKVKMNVNGVPVENRLISIHPNASNTLIYDSSDSNSYSIDNTDLVEFWIPETTTNTP